MRYSAGELQKTQARDGKSFQKELDDFCAQSYDDPLGFVLGAYPWPINGEPGPDRWQAEALTDIGQQVRARGFDGVRPVMPIRKAISSGHGAGKAQPDSLELHTPAGLKRWSDLRLGDEVFAGDGTPTKIVAIYDRGVREIYRVTFDDGSSTRVCAEHVWRVKGRQQRRNAGGWIDRTTADLLKLGTRRRNGKALARQWEIPTGGPAAFPAVAHTIPPYVLGVWLGDGGRNSSRVTSVDGEVIARMRAVGETVRQNRGIAWGVKHLRRRLKRLGIHDRYSYQKSVPVSYLEAPIVDRAELLRGLLDTDGECDRGGRIGFSSTSRSLAEDVVWLVRSLGGKARIQPTQQRPMYPGQDGTKKRGRLCWRVSIALPWAFRAFYVERKESRRRQQEARYLSRWIDSIEPDGAESCRCITVADPVGLYQTNDFIVTHNSALFGWLVDWIMSTRPHCQGSVTANTSDQLEFKTWAAIMKWTALCITSGWFTINSTIMYRKGHRPSWFCVPLPNDDKRADSFQGQHAKDSTSFYLVDEGSGLGVKIPEAIEGGLTDGEPMVFVAGNMLRNRGWFYECVFGKASKYWGAVVIDTRKSRLANKELIAQWEELHGVDSDFFRVRVRGLPPRASELQYIDKERVDLARGRTQPHLPSDPLIAGFDVSGGGSAWNVIRFRRGLNGRVKEPIRLEGSKDSNRMQRVGICAELLSDRRPDHQLAALFVDAAFGAPIVASLEALGHTNVFAINFGDEAPLPIDERGTACENMRAFMYKESKEWLLLGSLPDEDRLCDQACLPGFHLTKRGRLVLESKEDLKKRGEASPDDWDAFALTFAAPVASRVQVITRGEGVPLPSGPGAWMGM